MRRFDREARLAASLNHPNICTILDIGEADGLSFIAMELLEGESLKQRLRSGRLPLDQCSTSPRMSRAHSRARTWRTSFIETSRRETSS